MMKKDKKSVVKVGTQSIIERRKQTKNSQFLEDLKSGIMMTRKQIFSLGNVNRDEWKSGGRVQISGSQPH